MNKVLGYIESGKSEGVKLVLGGKRTLEETGGFKQPGFFGRDKSIFAHYRYTELKTVWIQLT